MPINRLWIARYQAAWFNSLGEGNPSLKAVERDVLRALSTYRPESGQPVRPSVEDLAKVAGCSVTAARQALEKAAQLGLLGEAAP